MNRLVDILINRLAITPRGPWRPRLLLACAVGGGALSCGGNSETGYVRTLHRSADPAAPGTEAPIVDEAPPSMRPPDETPVESSDVYEDPGCPQPPVPVRYDECDALAKTTGCVAGEGCYPFVVYPDGPCEPETYGALCAPVGVGEQGDPCDNSLCSAGFMCVATGRGTQCAQLCPFPGENTCPPGLLCGNVDVEGFGTCF